MIIFTHYKLLKAKEIPPLQGNFWKRSCKYSEVPIKQRDPKKRGVSENPKFSNRGSK